MLQIYIYRYWYRYILLYIQNYEQTIKHTFYTNIEHIGYGSTIPVRHTRPLQPCRRSSANDSLSSVRPFTASSRSETAMASEGFLAFHLPSNLDVSDFDWTFGRIKCDDDDDDNNGGAGGGGGGGLGLGLPIVFSKFTSVTVFSKGLGDPNLCPFWAV